MADLNGGKGKFWGVDENVKYADSFKGATKVAEKIKKGGTETKSDGYVVDAIDIDWGGLKLTTIADQWSWGLHTASSTEQNAGKGDNTQGIHSTAYLLNKISSSFTTIYNEIGGDDNAGLRKRIAGAEESIKAMANLSPTELTGIQHDLALIKQELEDPTIGSWTTIVDKLAYLGDDTVVKYVNDAVAGAKREAISAAASDATSKANNAKTEAINAAASDATSKANTALSNAKAYADTKKTEAINAAASDATSKANKAKTDAISAAASDAAAKDEQVKTDLTGSDENDTKDSITIWGARKHADEIENVVTAQADEWSRERANTAKSEAISAAASDATTKANNAKTEAINAAASDATSKANTALSNAKAYADTKKTEAINAAASDATSKANNAKTDAISAANNYTDTKFETLSNSAFHVRRIVESEEGILEFVTVSSYLG